MKQIKVSLMAIVLFVGVGTSAFTYAHNHGVINKKTTYSWFDAAAPHNKIVENVGDNPSLCPETQGVDCAYGFVGSISTYPGGRGSRQAYSENQ